MRKIFLFFYLFVITVNSQTQNSGKITYSFIANGSVMKTNLIFNGNKSIYNTLIPKSKKSVDVKTNDDRENEDNSELKINISPYNNIPDDLGLLTDLENKIIIDNKYLPKNVNGTEYDTLFVKDSARNIKWEIAEETKQINSFTCHKAVGDFRGRIYSVWFTLDIPVSFGPWKLNGLPGLILEASEAKNQYMFYVEKIEMNKEIIEINWENFQNKKYISPKKEMELFMESMDKINGEITEKIKSSLPRGVNSISTKTNKNIVEPETLMEFIFEDSIDEKN